MTIFRNLAYLLAVTILAICGCASPARDAEPVRTDVARVVSRDMSDHSDIPGLPQAMLAAQAEDAKVPPGVDSQLWEMLTDHLAEYLRSRPDLKSSSAPPTGPDNQIPNPVPVDDGAGGFLLEWNYVNIGDYDLNSEVNVADITPIAVNYQATPASPNWATAQLADGDFNLEINLADITPIGQYFLATVSGYTVFGIDASSNRIELGTVDFSSGTQETDGTGKPVISFSFNLATVDYVEYAVEPFHGSDPGPDPPNVTYITPGGGVTGSDVQFHVMLADGIPDSYSWDFGGGATPNTSTQAAPVVTLGAIGDYTLSLTLSYPDADLNIQIPMSVVPELLGTPIDIVDYFSLFTAQPLSGYALPGLSDADGPRDLFLGNDTLGPEDVLYSDGPLTYDNFHIYDTVQGSLCGQLTYRLRVIISYDAGNLNYHIEAVFINGPDSFLVDDNDPTSGCDLPSTIRHELIHFDIAEMGARAFRYKLLEILDDVETEGFSGQDALTEIASRMNTAFAPLETAVADLQYQFDFEQYIDENLNVVERTSGMNKWDADITSYFDATSPVADPHLSIDVTP